MKGHLVARHAFQVGGFLLLGCAWVSPSARRADAAVDETPVIMGGNGIGALRVGMHADSVRSHVTVVSDGIELGDEATPTRILRVTFQRDTVVAEIWRDRVARVIVYSARFRTLSGVGVGSTLGELSNVGELSAALVDGEYAVGVRNECGMSFRLDYEIPESVLSGGDIQLHFLTVNRGVTVRSVILGGCTEKSRS